MNNRAGCWWTESKSDPRWNMSGRAESCGGFVMPEDCERAIDAKASEIGEPPSDLTWNYMKD